jgi:hypothetical protein
MKSFQSYESLESGTRLSPITSDSFTEIPPCSGKLTHGGNTLLINDINIVHIISCHKKKQLHEPRCGGENLTAS